MGLEWILEVTVADLGIGCLGIILFFVLIFSWEHAFFIDERPVQTIAQILSICGIFYCAIHLYQSVKYTSIDEIIDSVQNTPIADSIVNLFKNLYFSGCLVLLALMIFIEKHKIQVAIYDATQPLYRSIWDRNTKIRMGMNVLKNDLRWARQCGQLVNYDAEGAFRARLECATFDELQEIAILAKADTARSKKKLIENILALDSNHEEE